MIVDKILEYIEKGEFKFEEALAKEIGDIASKTFSDKFMSNEEFDAKGKFWFSSAGKCARQLAYKYHGIETEGKKFDARGKLAFWMGDLAELAIVSLARVAGCPIVGTGAQQLKAAWDLGQYKITGRPDGLYISNEGFYLVEVKSMPSYRFKAFEDGEIDEAYLDQVTVGMMALNVKKTVFLAYNRDVCMLSERVISLDEGRATKIKANTDLVFKSTPENLPDRPYTPNEKGFYPWMCTYCHAVDTCLIKTGMANRVVVKDSYKIKKVEA